VETFHFFQPNFSLTVFLCFAFFSSLQFICSFRHICFFSLSQFSFAFGFVIDYVCSVLPCPVKGRCCRSVSIPSQMAPSEGEHLMVYGESSTKNTLSYGLHLETAISWITEKAAVI
jgi:hypothetical protein